MKMWTSSNHYELVAIVADLKSLLDEQDPDDWKYGDAEFGQKYVEKAYSFGVKTAETSRKATGSSDPGDPDIKRLRIDLVLLHGNVEMALRFALQGVRRGLGRHAVSLEQMQEQIDERRKDD